MFEGDLSGEQAKQEDVIDGLERAVVFERQLELAFVELGIDGLGAEPAVFGSPHDVVDHTSGI